MRTIWMLIATGVGATLAWPRVPAGAMLARPRMQGNTGDLSVPHKLGGVARDTQHPPAFQPDAEVKGMISCVFGLGAANACFADIDPSSGSVMVGELGLPVDALGVSDYNTILINTVDLSGASRGMSKFEYAMTLYHECKHVSNAHAQGSTAGDPTNEGADGACNHANQVSSEMATLVEKCEQQTSMGGTDPSAEDVCDALENSANYGSKLVNEGKSECSSSAYDAAKAEHENQTEFGNSCCQELLID